jgi:hypothetical protein
MANCQAGFLVASLATNEIDRLRLCKDLLYQNLNTVLNTHKET